MAKKKANKVFRIAHQNRHYFVIARHGKGAVSIAREKAIALPAKPSIKEVSWDNHALALNHEAPQ